jgi:hypothetical protein
MILIAAMFSIGCGKNTVHKDTLQTIEEAYIYALPLVIMDLTKIVSTNVIEFKDIAYGAPVNNFFHMQWIATAEDRAVVRPNVDTL